MGKRHNRRWKADEKFPAPGKRAEEEQKTPPTKEETHKPETTEPEK